MHMVQHLLIADVAAILLTLGLTRHILRPATRRIHRIERAAGPFASPWFGVVAYVGAMWIWHIPAMYDAALDHSFVHTLEHLTFAAAGLLYWWHLLSPIRSRLRLGGMGPVGYMASTKILVGFLGDPARVRAGPHLRRLRPARHALGHDRAGRPARRRPRSWRSSSRS